MEPSYEQKVFPDEEKRGRLRLVGSRDGRDSSVTIHQDVNLYATLLTDTQEVTHELAADRKGWVQVARGTAKVNDEQLYPGDGVAIDGPRSITLAGTSDTEILLFDMG